MVFKPDFCGLFWLNADSQDLWPWWFSGLISSLTFPMCEHILLPPPPHCTLPQQEKDVSSCSREEVWVSEQNMHDCCLLYQLLRFKNGWRSTVSCSGGIVKLAKKENLICERLSVCKREDNWAGRRERLTNRTMVMWKSDCWWSVTVKALMLSVTAWSEHMLPWLWTPAARGFTVFGRMRS